MTSSTAEAPADLRTRMGLRDLGAMTAYWLGLSITWGSLTTIVLPRLVEQAVPGAIKTTALSGIAALQALVSIIVQPMSGAASDHLVTPWGRRRPLMVAGVAVQTILILLLVVAHAYWAILVVMLSIELASNTAQGPYQGLLPDMVPPGERGLASGFIGAGNLAGNVIGVALSGVALAVGDIPLAVIFSAGSLLMGTVITAATMHETEGRSGGGPARAVDWARELVHLSRWATPVRRIVLEVWGRDVLEQRDYLWLLASRLAILMAAGTLQPFAYYYLEDSLGLGANAGLAFAPLAGAVALVALVSAVPGGAMTARWGRVRTVALSAVSGTIGALLFALAPNYASLFAIAIPFGLALGVFLSADWALLTDVAPLDQAGRYLGLSNTVTAGAGVLAVAIGGPIADLVNRYQFGLGYRAIFAIAALEFAVGAWSVLHVHEPRAGAAALGEDGEALGTGDA
ncbi:MAG: MFS transporter [Candidatus Limnocylindrales bacterium]